MAAWKPHFWANHNFNTPPPSPPPPPWCCATAVRSISTAASRSRGWASLDQSPKRDADGFSTCARFDMLIAALRGDDRTAPEILCEVSCGSMPAPAMPPKSLGCGGGTLDGQQTVGRGACRWCRRGSTEKPRACHRMHFLAERSGNIGRADTGNELKMVTSGDKMEGGCAGPTSRGHWKVARTDRAAFERKDYVIGDAVKFDDNSRPELGLFSRPRRRRPSSSIRHRGQCRHVDALGRDMGARAAGAGIAYRTWRRRGGAFWCFRTSRRRRPLRVWPDSASAEEFIGHEKVPDASSRVCKLESANGNFRARTTRACCAEPASRRWRRDHRKGTSTSARC